MLLKVGARLSADEKDGDTKCCPCESLLVRDELPCFRLYKNGLKASGKFCGAEIT